ncbi:hypothetical protein SE17_38530 [Kouleothrix aurantiaca]|uniref:Uncharacterized protein n=1 Tax=Kouleothrix aurantiaca TaxID=186479 RepID=A0A0P9DE57_9CHLR|nr:hypothetical protein SE17_38530 [Kouleothrix aurantiaca]
MKAYSGLMAVALLAAALLMSACGAAPEAATDEAKPVTVESLTGASEPTKETLTEDAAKRLDIQTAAVSEADLAGVKHTTVPYASVIYDTEGATWVYLNTEPNTFVRHGITVNDIQGDTAFLADTLPAGSSVVTVGVAELYGAESEFEEE